MNIVYILFTMIQIPIFLSFVWTSQSLFYALSIMHFVEKSLICLNRSHNQGRVSGSAQNCARVIGSRVNVVTLRDQMVRLARFSCRFFTAAMAGNKAEKKN